jgi:ABC-2 type transport system permease protein
MIKKESIELMRDGRTLAVMMSIPIILLMIFAYAVTSDIRLLPLAVYDDDRTTMSRELVQAVDSTRHFVVHRVNDLREIDEGVHDGAYKAAVVIPRGFLSDVVGGGRPRLQVILDGSDPTVSNVADGYLLAIAGNFYSQKVGALLPAAASPPIDFRTRIIYNPRMESIVYMVPGLLGYILAFLTVLITSMATIRERQSGTYEQLMVTPIKPAEILIGKVIPYGLVSVVNMVIIIALGYFIFGVAAKGSLILLFIFAIVFVIATLMQGLLFSGVSHTPQQAVQMTIAITMPSLILSGFIFPLFIMPRFFQVLSVLFPLTFFLRIARGIYVKGEGLEYMVLDALVVLVFVVVFSVLASRALTKRSA